jgi:hypothetical protein
MSGGEMVRMFQIEIAAMRRWFSANGLTRKEPAVRMFLDLLDRNLQMQEFSIRPPGRLRYFTSVVKEGPCRKRNSVVEADGAELSGVAAGAAFWVSEGRGYV